MRPPARRHSVDRHDVLMRHEHDRLQARVGALPGDEEAVPANLFDLERGKDARVRRFEERVQLEEDLKARVFWTAHVVKRLGAL